MGPSTNRTTEPSITTLETLASTPTSIGHMALHFRPGDRELATRFFQLLGARVRAFPNPLSDEPLHIVALDGADPDKADNIVYLFAMKPAQLELEATIAEKLGADTDDPHPALQAFLDHRTQWPESYLHFGVHFASLDEIEAAVQRVQAEMADDPAFGRRIHSMQILKARGQEGDHEIDERMAASPVFSAAQDYAYGKHGVQVHIRTDLFSTGVTFGGSIVELDYVFTGPGRERNPFNSLLP